jgi:hypothetical protein
VTVTFFLTNTKEEDELWLMTKDSQTKKIKAHIKFDITMVNTMNTKEYIKKIESLKISNNYEKIPNNEPPKKCN